MHINIKLYGAMKKYAPGDTTQFELIIESGASLKDILRLFSIPEKGYVFLVNGRRIDKTSCFNEGDTLVLFPEISGG
ncbi:MoaD/ThiS family protein [Desulfobacula sp.]|uniref:MoaD/ThiS family protein n=1 Tax=Desulfobacula sp. TaxID=2593537 RepID=UPI003427A3E3